jgi:hypothetical protein
MCFPNATAQENPQDKGASMLAAYNSGPLPTIGAEQMVRKVEPFGPDFAGGAEGMPGMVVPRHIERSLDAGRPGAISEIFLNR